MKGSATLYSKEYFELVKQHLNPGGIVTQWVPLYESDTATVKSEIATFFDVFPNGTVWGNDKRRRLRYGGAGTGGADEDRPGRDAGAAGAAGLRAPWRSRCTRWASIRCRALLATYAGQESDLQPWLAGAEINRDGNLRLQYMAGLALNTSMEATIYSQILSYRRFPMNLFQGSEDKLQALRYAMEASGTQ